MVDIEAKVYSDKFISDDTLGQPAIGYTIELYRDSCLLSTTKTDPTGHFIFKNVKEGEYNVIVRNDKEKFGHISEYIGEWQGITSIYLGNENTPFIRRYFKHGFQLSPGYYFTSDHAYENVAKRNRLSHSDIYGYRKRN